MKTSYRHVAAVAAVPVLAVALLGCGSDNGGDAEGTVELTVATMPIVDLAPIHLGIEQGFFEEEGLVLNLEEQTGGAASVPGVIAGDFDIAFGNTVSAMVARDQGLPLAFVMPASASSGDANRDYTAIIVPEDSDIQTPADLAGARVSVNNLSNIGDTTVRGIVDADGGDESAIQFVEVGFPDVEASLANGQIDAGWSNDPFLTSSLEDGYRVIAWNYYDTHPELLAAGYFATEQYLAENEDVIDRFVSAMQRSNEYATDNPDEARRIVGEYTEISEELRQSMTLPGFPTEFNTEAVQTLADLAYRFGTLSDEVDVPALLGE